eukprot:TRINITY_DN5372_c0_g1_i1.p1 TRINITY_DN5372_c0_g1~~TRINITY_DN5372_c0_g1_i1.p1  ORF type:complete len:462 (+),score=79.03 TRINITY_DN5372_c0_g1_i1:33-1418(+)
MTRVFLSLLCVSILSVLVLGEIPAHRITTLPGYTGTLPSKQYSGYISVDQKNGRNLHYWFVQSERAPATDPVVLWLNGGPGCSSMDGLVYELGPIVFEVDEVNGNGVPIVKDRPTRWNKIANMIFLEAPAGVGFSYSDTPGDYQTNDQKTAEDNWKFLVEFFTKAYPEFASNPFYISGESYAGIYIPTLANAIVEHNKKGDSKINLKGVLVGNGCVGSEVGVCSSRGDEMRMEYMHKRALFADNLYTKIDKTCDWKNRSLECGHLLSEMGRQVGGVNIYDIYSPCIRSAGSRVPIHKDSVFSHLLNAKPSENGPDWCVGAVTAFTWFNDETVRAALHVGDASKLGAWTVCTGKISYTWSTPSVMPIYHTLLNAGMKVLIYNGDTDACVPINDNEEWTAAMGLSLKEEWRPWIVDSQVAGFVTTYDKGFTFLTVKGAGHMVPQVRPVTAFAMFSRYLNGEPY